MTLEEKLDEMERIGRQKIRESTSQDWERYTQLALECLKEIKELRAVALRRG